MKYLITESKSREEKQKLEEMGLYCYDLRDSDFGSDIATIEKRVLVNNIGSMITNKEIPLGDKYPNDFVDYNSFVENDKNKCVSTIQELLEKNKSKDNDRGR
ncbi:MAG: LPD28 domain-containing protein [Bacilli bacterium]